jgi:hypothetical protein
LNALIDTFQASNRSAKYYAGAFRVWHVLGQTCVGNSLDGGCQGDMRRTRETAGFFSFNVFLYVEIGDLASNLARHIGCVELGDTADARAPSQQTLPKLRHRAA